MHELTRLIIGQRVTVRGEGPYQALRGEVGTVERCIDAPMMSDHGCLLVVSFGYDEYAFDLHELAPASVSECVTA